MGAGVGGRERIERGTIKSGGSAPPLFCAQWRCGEGPATFGGGRRRAHSAG
jgi:hypothetical protein